MKSTYNFTSPFPGSTDGKESACSIGDTGSIPKLGRSPGEGNGNPLQYSCLENSMDSPCGCKKSDMTERLTLSLSDLDAFFFISLSLSLSLLFLNFFFLPISLVRASSTMLNRSGESVHSYLVPDLREKAFNLLLLSMVLAVGFSVSFLFHICF